MANELVNKYAQLAGQVRGRDKAEMGLERRSAQVQMRNEIDRQRKEREAAEAEERKGWWKQLIPGALGLVGAGIGTAVGGPVGTYFGGALGGMLGSGISAKQGVPGAGAAFNQFSPMMMQAMAQMGAPDQFGDNYNGTGANLSDLRKEYGDNYGRGGYSSNPIDMAAGLNTGPAAPMWDPDSLGAGWDPDASRYYSPRGRNPGSPF